MMSTGRKVFAKSQNPTPSCWPDGTRKSSGNAFTAYLDGQPSILASAKDVQYAAATISSSASVSRQQAKGIEPLRLGALSNKSHNNPRMRLPEWIGPNKPHHRRWAAIAPPAPSDHDDHDDLGDPAS